MHLKKFTYALLALSMMAVTVVPSFANKVVTVVKAPVEASITTINLSDEKILINGKTVSSDAKQPVYTSHDIIYYENKTAYESGNTYGEGAEKDQHTKEEAAKHTVVNITQPGTYRISGNLSYGQIFVNVGEEEKDKVTLILDNADISCTVAPAVFFYKVYECDSNVTTETATNSVDTSNAGAKVILADDSQNYINGSHVSKIYKDNTEQKKLHKYDGAFYSRMSMEIAGETKGNGILNITADNEGLDSELHLTINGGHINIQSADDGINVNEDGISVFTMNAGYLNIYAGNGAEGDGIDSNGWNVINGGTVIALANPNSPDGGIDSDMGTTINGGTVIGAGNMYDPIEDSSKQPFMCLQFAQKSEQLITVTNEKDEALFAYDFPNNYSYIVFSTPELKAGTYHVYEGGKIEGSLTDGYYSTITSYQKGTALHHGGTITMTDDRKSPGSKNGADANLAIKDGNTPPTMPDNMKEGANPPAMPDGTKPGDTPPAMPNGMKPGDTPPAMPDGMKPGDNPPTMPNGFGMRSSSETETYDFVLSDKSKIFTNLSSSTLNNVAQNK